MREANEEAQQEDREEAQQRMPRAHTASPPQSQHTVARRRPRLPGLRGRARAERVYDVLGWAPTQRRRRRSPALLMIETTGPDETGMAVTEGASGPLASLTVELTEGARYG